jgi:hypothetical protein
MSRLTLLAVLVALAATACGVGTSSDEAPSSPPASSEAAEHEVAAPSDAAEDAQDFPKVVAAAARRGNDNTIRFDVTVSSPYDSPQRYADAWRIIDPTAPSMAFASCSTTTRESSHSCDRWTESRFRTESSQ